ncbi:NAD-dependent epimerase/dehydratase [Obba rivulosa]|uniref:NAD-dependent epimerase/dehydratase n=1 Tax=Obba rivulosa TaxID=1052685 RepID=A0A8E2AIB3_9APHY|nr:NAD-dependent epimerase/dehydratase [Obba rivulosa]
MLSPKSTILITGGHGFIGGHVAQRLCADGHTIRLSDITPISYLALPNAQFVQGNLCDQAFCTRIVEGVDVVMHFAAAMGGMGTIHPGNDFIIYQTNHVMTINLLSACVNAGVKSFFYASSACVYPDMLQARDDQDVRLKEQDVWAQLPPHPQGLYGLEKLHTEQVLHQFSSQLDIRIARFHNVYGPGGCWTGGREKAPAAFLRKAFAAKMLGSFPCNLEIWGSGTQRRSFCFIDDAVKAIVNLLGSNCRDPVNIGSDRSVTIEELAQVAMRRAGIDPDQAVIQRDSSKPVGVASRNSDNSFVNQQLGWSPETTLAQGMHQTGVWICGEIEKVIIGMDPEERAETLRRMQKSELVDLHFDGRIFAILLPITSKGLSSPQQCLANLTRFARSLIATTADDIQRLGEVYQIRVYLAVDSDDEFLWKPDGSSKAGDVLQAHSLAHVTIRCDFPRGHVCDLWRHCAFRAWEDGCDYFTLMGDDVILEDPNWMSSVHKAFRELSSEENVPRGFGCVAFTDISFPGMPTFPVIHRTHMDIFGGVVVPETFINQDGDPFLFQLYRRWGCSRMIDCRLQNQVGGSDDARYSKVSAVGWTFEPLTRATFTVETWLRRHHSNVKRKLALDVVIPCYRVNVEYLDAFVALKSSATCTVMFIIIVDDPASPNISELMQKYAHRPDIRIRVNNVNSGASASRNRGLQESSAEWVHFLDDDVTPREDLLLESERTIRAHPDAAGFVANAQFPSADSIYTAAVHLAGVTFFWDIASEEKAAAMNMVCDVPWGVTANLIARRDVQDGVEFDTTFPKTGGGEDIDFCLKKRAFSVAQGRKGFHAAPDVVVTHPWWNIGHRNYWRFYMWSKGDGGLIKIYPQYTYRDAAPNAAELLLLSVLVTVVGCVMRVAGVPGHSYGIILLGAKMIAIVVSVNMVHDTYRHLWRDIGRTVSLKTSVTGFRWLLAVLESTLIRVFSECGRLVGILERGEWRCIGLRFEWFVSRAGNGPRDEERRNSSQRMALWVTALAIAVSVL